MRIWTVLSVRNLYMVLPGGGNICGYRLFFCASCSDDVELWLYAPLRVEPLPRRLISFEGCEGGLNLSGCSNTIGLDLSVVEALRCCIRNAGDEERASGRWANRRLPSDDRSSRAAIPVYCNRVIFAGCLCELLGVKVQLPLLFDEVKDKGLAPASTHARQTRPTNI